MKTEIVYVCSPDRDEHLFASMRSLLTSGTEFDLLTVYCVGPVPSYWSTSDSRIVYKEVPRLTGACFNGSKIYMCSGNAPRTVYIDTDTLVVRPLNEIWDNADPSVDLLARTANWYEPGASWYTRRIDAAGVPYIPYFNTGFLIFQNGSQETLFEPWLSFMQRIQAGELEDVKKTCSDQFAFACAVSQTGLKYELLTQTEHAYGWIGEYEEFDTNSYLLHFGSDTFTKEIPRFEAQNNIDDASLPFTSGFLPNRIQMNQKMRSLKYKLARTLKD